MLTPSHSVVSVIGVLAEPTACVEAQSFTSGLRPDGTSPFSNQGNVFIEV